MLKEKKGSYAFVVDLKAPQEIQKTKSQGPKGIAFTVDLSGNSSYKLS